MFANFLSHFDFVKTKILTSNMGIRESTIWDMEIAPLISVQQSLILFYNYRFSLQLMKQGGTEWVIVDYSAMKFSFSLPGCSACRQSLLYLTPAFPPNILTLSDRKWQLSHWNMEKGIVCSRARVWIRSTYLPFY